MIGFLTVGAKVFGGGEESRAKGAKDAKVEGKEDDEIAGGVGEWGFALDKELGLGLGLGLLVDGKGRGQCLAF